MVWSPNQTSNWYIDIEDYYPGDEYVDWVGMSTYNNISSAASDGIGSQSDAWYGRGVYENQIERIRPIIEAYGDHKPIMISECGFCYQNTKGTETVDHAVESLRYFYTYVNMVYPQVKAVFYFNTNFNGRHYSLTKNDRINAVYLETTQANVSMQATVGGAQKYYVPLDSFSESTAQIKLSAYAYMPGSNAKVSYSLNGNKLYESNAYPYSYTLSFSKTGTHELEVKAVYGKTTTKKWYSVTVSGDGKINVTGIIPGDLNSDKKLNSRDIISLMKLVISKKPKVTSTTDVNGDGKINSRDVITLMQLVLAQ